jgi:hypothetical protein
MLIRNSNLQIVEATYTNANGDYSFTNIPTGNYSIYAEEINYSSIPVTPIVITAAAPESHNIDFNKDMAKRSIAPRNALCICGPGSTETKLAVFPNPASEILTISWTGAADASNQFTITSITGNVVARSPLVSGSRGSIEMNISSLAGGVYFVHGTGSLAGSVSKLIVR